MDIAGIRRLIGVFLVGVVVELSDLVAAVKHGYPGLRQHAGMEHDVQTDGGLPFVFILCGFCALDAAHGGCRSAEPCILCYGIVVVQLAAADTVRYFTCKFLVFVGNEQEETERQYIQELLAYNIEGLIVMSFTLPSAELAKLPIPVVTIEREDRYVSSVNTDNYMGGVQATSLLARHNCDILIHINTTDTTPERPAYGRIRGFLDICGEKKLNHRLIYVSPGNTFEEMQESLSEVVQELDTAYAGMRKGIFVSGDTRANIFLNLLIRKYGSLPADYRIVGFDDSPISREAVIPISTVGQQIEKMAFEAVSMLVEQMNERKKRRPVLLQEPVHRVLTPILIRRETTETGEETVIN